VSLHTQRTASQSQAAHDHDSEPNGKGRTCGLRPAATGAGGPRPGVADHAPNPSLAFSALLFLLHQQLDGHMRVCACCKPRTAGPGLLATFTLTAAAPRTTSVTWSPRTRTAVSARASPGSCSAQDYTARVPSRATKRRSRLRFGLTRGAGYGFSVARVWLVALRFAIL